MTIIAPNNQDKIAACQQKQYFVTRSDLPLCCPMPDMVLWNAHPRVYLAIEEEGTSICPYCGSEYFLSEASRVS